MGLLFVKLFKEEVSVFIHLLKVANKLEVTLNQKTNILQMLKETCEYRLIVLFAVLKGIFGQQNNFLLAKLCQKIL